MAKRSTRLAATGLALGAALSLLGTAGSAEATAQSINTTIQGGSNLREAATTNSGLVGTTTSTSKAFIRCYTRGQYVEAGGYGTDVWYFGYVDDYSATPPHSYYDVWVWGGNVNVGADPSPQLSPC
ncbi:hypothetical protein SAMN06272735_2828 [Streptomyces sp. TLI_55]|uniref:hypothetical protein n=1 Tax=Streptomyces sp. TLI_55 TaxID=1938861 RepID=UPI000BC3F91C|nr:hypothetical protein [Streptomyces sp. TLI_55]SNX58338.1 hypothetical protein SAMN06272735_2828 [Streptomyces sp. TLI_55]